mmetsp:Transcript_60192/g.189082  ORF Transcript_60192/g.189082 Transcript_60192/m.189082 type:complete len:371 (+) Transcript_60192:331-1443(+)
MVRQQPCRSGRLAPAAHGLRPSLATAGRRHGLGKLPRQCGAGGVQVRGQAPPLHGRGPHAQRPVAAEPHAEKAAQTRQLASAHACGDLRPVSVRHGPVQARRGAQVARGARLQLLQDLAYLPPGSPAQLRELHSLVSGGLGGPALQGHGQAEEHRQEAGLEERAGGGRRRPRPSGRLLEEPTLGGGVQLSPRSPGQLPQRLAQLRRRHLQPGSLLLQQAEAFGGLPRQRGALRAAAAAATLEALLPLELGGPRGLRQVQHAVAVGELRARLQRAGREEGKRPPRKGHRHRRRRAGVVHEGGQGPDGGDPPARARGRVLLRPQRLLDLAGVGACGLPEPVHLETVQRQDPVDALGLERARRRGETLHGLGA